MATSGQTGVGANLLFAPRLLFGGAWLFFISHLHSFRWVVDTMFPTPPIEIEIGLCHIPRQVKGVHRRTAPITRPLIWRSLLPIAARR